MTGRRLRILGIYFFMASMGLLVSACVVKPDETEVSEAPRIPLAELEAEIRTEWLEIKSEGAIMWSPVSTPWLPVEWPAGDDTLWVRYIYAQGRDAQLADAVRISTPWARAEARPGEELVSIIPLRNRVEEVGVQGVFPLPAERPVILEADQASAPPFLWSGGMPEPGSAAEAKLRMAYQSWIRYNRVIADQVKDAHEDFLRWVELD